MNEFKKLMGDAISDETAVALQTILDTHLAESATKAKAEVDKLQEELTQAQEKANELQEALDNASKDKDDQMRLCSQKAPTHLMRFASKFGCLPVSFSPKSGKASLTR